MPALSRKSNDRTDASPSKAGAPRAGPLVLVVEDHEDTRFLLTYMLGMRGCRVLEAADGEEAVRVAESQRPDLVLMDISLPRVDGLKATRRMRELVALREVPVIFLSGHAHPSSRALALATGGDDYLVKPLRLGELDAAIERHLGKSAAMKPM